LTIFRTIDRIRTGSENWNARAGQRHRKLQRSLSAELHDHTERLLALRHCARVLERQRLEVKPIRDIVIGRDRLRIAIHHDRFESRFLERETPMNAAVIELDPLPYPVRTAAENYYFFPRRRRRFILALVGRVEIGSECLELR